MKLVTEPANVTRLGATGPQERFAVRSNRVLRALREQGAGKAEAHELALAALAEVGGGAEIATAGLRSAARAETARSRAGGCPGRPSTSSAACAAGGQPPDLAEATKARTSPAGSEYASPSASSTAPMYSSAQAGNS